MLRGSEFLSSYKKQIRANGKFPAGFYKPFFQIYCFLHYVMRRHNSIILLLSRRKNKDVVVSLDNIPSLIFKVVDGYHFIIQFWNAYLISLFFLTAFASFPLSFSFPPSPHLFDYTHPHYPPCRIEWIFCLCQCHWLGSDMVRIFIQFDDSVPDMKCRVHFMPGNWQGLQNIHEYFVVQVIVLT